MSSNESDTDGSDRYGPATVMCPFCKETVETESGPTRRVEVDHCDNGWFVADLETEKTGYTESFNPGGERDAE